MSPASLRSALTPMWRISLTMVDTSCKRGTFDRVSVSAVKSAAQSSGSAAFLAPAMATLPFKERPPRISNLSIACQAVQAWAFHSAGVKVFIDKACTSSLAIFSPKVA